MTTWHQSLQWRHQLKVDLRGQPGDSLRVFCDLQSTGSSGHKVCDLQPGVRVVIWPVTCNQVVRVVIWPATCKQTAWMVNRLMTGNQAALVGIWSVTCSQASHVVSDLQPCGSDGLVIGDLYTLVTLVVFFCNLLVHMMCSLSCNYFTHIVSLNSDPDNTHCGSNYLPPPKPKMMTCHHSPHLSFWSYHHSLQRSPPFHSNLVGLVSPYLP